LSKYIFLIIIGPLSVSEEGKGRYRLWCHGAVIDCGAMEQL